jgi:hypothetical protein
MAIWHVADDYEELIVANAPEWSRWLREHSAQSRGVCQFVALAAALAASTTSCRPRTEPAIKRTRHS